MYINHLVKDKQNENSSVECYWGWVDYMAQLFRLVTKNTRMHFHPKKHIFLNIEYELIWIIMGFVVRFCLNLILHLHSFLPDIPLFHTLLCMLPEY